MAQGDDERWLERLAGREAEMTQAASREPDALRRALLARDQAERRRLDSEARPDEHALQSLLFRLRRRTPRFYECRGSKHDLSCCAWQATASCSGKGTCSKRSDSIRGPSMQHLPRS